MKKIDINNDSLKKLVSEEVIRMNNRVRLEEEKKNILNRLREIKEREDSEK